MSWLRSSEAYEWATASFYGLLPDCQPRCACQAANQAIDEYLEDEEPSSEATTTRTPKLPRPRQVSPRPVVIDAKDVETERVKWLWRGRLPLRQAGHSGGRPGPGEVNPGPGSRSQDLQPPALP